MSIPEFTIPKSMNNSNIPPNQSNPALYAATILGLVMVALISIVSIFLIRPDADNMAIITIIIGFTGSAITGILAFIKSDQTGKAVNEVHLSLNSRLSEWMRDKETEKATSIIASKAEGVIEGALITRRKETS